LSAAKAHTTAGHMRSSRRRRQCWRQAFDIRSGRRSADVEHLFGGSAGCFDSPLRLAAAGDIRFEACFGPQRSFPRLPAKPRIWQR